MQQPLSPTAVTPQSQRRSLGQVHPPHAPPSPLAKQHQTQSQFLGRTQGVQASATPHQVLQRSQSAVLQPAVQPSAPQRVPGDVRSPVPAGNHFREVPCDVSVEEVPLRVGMDQLVNTDANTMMFKCMLCECVAWRPRVTMCCQKVFCGPCLENWLQSSSNCPQCHVSIMSGDGSTGGCGEQRIERLDQHSQGVQAVLWRVYGNLRVRCEHERTGCDWCGDMFSYEQHRRACRKTCRDPVGVDLLSLLQPQSATSKSTMGASQPSVVALKPSGQPAQSTELSGVIGGTYAVVRSHQAGDASQLSLRSGDRVLVQQVAAHGWVFGRRLEGEGNLEGWFPSFCLPEQRSPPPQQSPPPRPPPAGSTQVTRDYEACDPVQLSVKEGELVHVRQRDQSGWTFVVRVNLQGTKREGWVPDWLLQKDA